MIRASRKLVKVVPIRASMHQFKSLDKVISSFPSVAPQNQLQCKTLQASQQRPHECASSLPSDPIYVALRYVWYGFVHSKGRSGLLKPWWRHHGFVCLSCKKPRLSSTGWGRCNMVPSRAPAILAICSDQDQLQFAIIRKQMK